MKHLWTRIVVWWDWKVYAMATNSIRRMCERNDGFAYLFKLSIDDWLEKYPLAESHKRATEEFYKAMRDWPKEETK